MTIDQEMRFDLIRSVIGREPKGTVLDVGCGDGSLARTLADDGCRAFACDLPSPFRSVLRAPHAFYANGCRLPIGSDSFDFAVSCDVLEHVQPADRKEFLAELVRVTRPGGTVVVTAFVKKTLSFRIWGAIWLILRGSLPSWYCEHVTIPTPDMQHIIDTVQTFSARLLLARRHQGPLSLFSVGIQNAFGTERFSSWAPVVERADCLGSRMSCLLVFRKG